MSNKPDFLAVCSFLLIFLLGSCGGGNTDTDTTVEEQALTIPTQVQLSAWIGANDTKVTFSEDAQGLMLTRSTDNDCDLENYSTCVRGQQNLVSEHSIIDTAANLTRPAWYWVNNNQVTSRPLAITAESFPRRSHHQIVSFKNKLWLIGG